MNDKLIEALEDFEGKLEGWAAAYPLTIFREPSDEELKSAHEALKTVGLTLDVLSASAMRYVATSLAAHFLPVREALAASKQEPKTKPSYPPDDGPLTDEQIAAIKKATSKQKPQAQAEPFTDDWWIDLAQRHAAKDWDCQKPDGYLDAVKSLVNDALQSHREAIAKSDKRISLLTNMLEQSQSECQRLQNDNDKKDAAREACVEALEYYQSKDTTLDAKLSVGNAAITQAKEARK